jgi:haloacetate dehalogenase
VSVSGATILNRTISLAHLLRPFSAEGSLFSNWCVVRGMLEEYRAGLTVDDRDERADRAAGRRLQQPLLVLWSTRDDLEDLYGDPLIIWRNWADDVSGHGIDSGHHMAELAPDELASELGRFLT